MPQNDMLRGAYCPLIVPFSDGKIDYDTYGKLIERQIAEGTHGLLVNATSGEPTMLTLEERGQLAEFVIKISAGRRPVCAGTASESFEENSALVDRFDKAGADSILVVTPYLCLTAAARRRLILRQPWRTHKQTISDLSYPGARELYAHGRYARRNQGQGSAISEASKILTAMLALSPARTRVLGVIFVSLLAWSFRPCRCLASEAAE